MCLFPTSPTTTAGERSSLNGLFIAGLTAMYCSFITLYPLFYTSLINE
nr:MAG TPA: hypothetical protein [Caudoviricetes sp.]